jgi:uncharacterized protein
MSKSVAEKMGIKAGSRAFNDMLQRVEHAGGKILLPKTPISGDRGFAYFEDTEGNRIGLHSAA